MGVRLDLIEFCNGDVPGTSGFLKALDSLAWVLGSRVSPFPRFTKEVGKQAFSRFALTLAVGRVCLCIPARASVR